MKTSNQNEESTVQLWLLLEQQTERLTMGDSTSVPTETAESLLAGIRFALRMEEQTRKDPLREAEAASDGGPAGRAAVPAEKPDASLVRRFEQGQLVIRQMVVAGLRLLEEALATRLPLENRSYQETYDELAGFFQHYDAEFMPQEVPCMIDYQLCCGPPEGMEGIEYMQAWLSRLICENRFCGAFPMDTVTLLLQASCPDYRGLGINLFEPVFTNALGLALTDGDIRPLQITAQDRLALHQLFRQGNLSRLRMLFYRAADSLADHSGLVSRQDRRYLRRAAEQVLHRAIALRNEPEGRAYEQLFVSLPEDGQPLPPRY